jgi:putative transcriptional regulator
MKALDEFQDYFLIATPKLDGSFFERSVAYIAAHSSSQGAMGFVINRAIGGSATEIFKNMDIETDNPYLEQLPMIAGGPLEPKHGFIVHRDGAVFCETLHPSKQVSITCSPDILEVIAKQNEPIDAFITLGFSKWEAGQLEKELEQHYWLLHPGSPQILFDTPIEERWYAALELTGVKPHQLFYTAGHC